MDALKGAVTLESPSEGETEDLNKCRNYFADLFRSEGFTVTEVETYSSKYANHLLVEYGKNAGDAAKSFKAWQDANRETLNKIKEGTAKSTDLPQVSWDGGSGNYVLFGGHYDTVQKKGAFGDPWVETEDTVVGPGILDMKSGGILVWFVVKALKELNLFPEDGHVVFFLSGDEETGSKGSAEYYKEMARHAKAALITEPATGIVGLDPNHIGGVKIGRFGRGNYTFVAEGTPYHSGINPTFAESALIELSLQAVRLEQMTFFDKVNPETGRPESVTVGCTHLEAGQAGQCTVPGDGVLSIDARYSTVALAEEYDKVFQNMVSFNPKVKIKTLGGIEKPPFDKDLPGNKKLQELVLEIGREFGVDMQLGMVRSGSDANFTSSTGCPTLDGVGVTGGHIHQPGEFIFCDHIPFRAAFLAELTLRLL